MADPFTVIGLVVTTLKTITVAKNHVETIVRAPLSVSALSSDLADIESLLRQLGHITSEKGADELEMHKLLAGPIASCESASNQLHKLIDPFVKTSGGMKTWSRLTFGFKESDILLLSSKLASCKQNLTLAITSTNLLASQKNVRGIKRIQNHLGIETSSVASVDINGRTHENIESWKMQIETVMEEEPASSIPSPGHLYTSEPQEHQTTPQGFSWEKTNVASEIETPQKKPLASCKICDKTFGTSFRLGIHRVTGCPGRPALRKGRRLPPRRTEPEKRDDQDSRHAFYLPDDISDNKSSAHRRRTTTSFSRSYSPSPPPSPPSQAILFPQPDAKPRCSKCGTQFRNAAALRSHKRYAKCPAKQLSLQKPT